MEKTTVSIVIPCKNESPHLEKMLISLAEVYQDRDLEVIVVDDASTDDSCHFLNGDGRDRFPWEVNLLKSPGIGPSRARNKGAWSAKGSILIFCDGHLLFSHKDWISKLVNSLKENSAAAVVPGIGAVGAEEVVGYGVTLDKDLSFTWLPQPKEITEVPVAPGGCVAVDREIFKKIGGFEDNFLSWGFEDIEFSIRLWLLGYRILVTPDTRVEHVFRTKHPYKVKYEDIDYNLLWMAICHFNRRRLLQVVNKVAKRGTLSNNLFELDKANVWGKREELLKKRKRTDDWYFDKFNIPF
ncbi:glycosyltransferase involved in cell wall biosynthesis [Desulfitispora alkaliphila]|uniref:glycosyltransferase family 2 protein n=1 Tax=Desulfitispora alkaliphila TaxID=622674 RepID=UPI003D1D0305